MMSRENDHQPRSQGFSLVKGKALGTRLNDYGYIEVM